MENLFKCEDKTVVVTGGASGLGAAFVEEFLKEGAKSVAILDISDTGKVTAERLEEDYPNKVFFIKCDAANEESISKSFDAVVGKLKQIDIIVNNAGLMNDSPQVWETMCDLNYRGLVSFTLKSIEKMRKDKGGAGGTIVNVSSVLALMDMKYLPVYAGTKSAVLHFSKCLAVPPFFERTGIRVLTICFGPTNTPLLHNLDRLCYEPNLGREFKDDHVQLEFQSVASAVQSFMVMVKTGKPGTIWVSTDNKPAKDVTANMNKVTEMMSKIGTLDIE